MGSTKHRKMRGTRSAGRGRGKSHNSNSGNRGGFGRAGSGKKGDAKKPSYWHEKFGKKAFGMNVKHTPITLNISDIQHRVEVLQASGKVKKEPVSSDFSKLGLSKLLGSGTITVGVEGSVEAA